MSNTSTCPCPQPYVSSTLGTLDTCVQQHYIDQSYHFSIPTLLSAPRHPAALSSPSPSSQPASKQPSHLRAVHIHPSPTWLARAWSSNNPSNRLLPFRSCQSYAPTLALPPLYCTYCWPAKAYQNRYSTPGLPTRRISRPPIPAAVPSLSLLNLDDCAFEVASR
jgi:hypothetical protein